MLIGGELMIKFVDVTKVYDANKNGTTIIMATHARDIVDTMKKRVIAVESGTIIRDEIRGTYDYEH